MLKEMDCTDSQVRKILSPANGGLSVEAVQALDMHTKYGVDLAPILQDARQRGGAALVVNLAGDDSSAPLNAFLAAAQPEKLSLAITAVAKAADAEEIYLVKPKEIDFMFTGAEGTANGLVVKTVEAGRSLVLREESALYHWIASGVLSASPMEKEFPSQGWQGRPAIALDAETLCRIYEAAKPGYIESKLVVIFCAGESRVAEVKAETSLQTLLTECGIQPEKSVLVGGVSGEFVAAGQCGQKTVGLDAQWDSIVVYGEKDCLADVTKNLAIQANRESCKTCVLCREGTWHFQAITQDITAGRAKKEDLAMILDIGPLIQVGALCHLGRGMARAIVSSIEQNRPELEAHFTKKVCPAGVCKAFAKLAIDPAKCTGCGACIDVCDEDAITGRKKFIHIIDNDLCENCGKCADVCEEHAIVAQDGTVRVPKKPVKVGKFK